MTPSAALEFIAGHGVVLEAGRGPVPNFADAVAGVPIKGSWWGHPRGREIFRLTRELRDAADIAVCRLVDDKVTYVHARLWPALARLAPQLPAKSLARVTEVHTKSGKHALRTQPFAKWLPPEARSRGSQLNEAEAIAALGAWIRPLLKKSR